VNLFLGKIKKVLPNQNENENVAKSFSILFSKFGDFFKEIVKILFYFHFSHFGENPPPPPPKKKYWTVF